MTELKPCPCCGPKAFITPSTKCDPQAGKHCWTAELRCHECGLNISRSEATEKEALHEAIEAWNTRAERTCKPDVFMDEQITESIQRWLGECECGAILGEGTDEYRVSLCFPNYCPCCGAKVVE